MSHPLHRRLDTLLMSAPGTRWMRDPTRGGVGTAVNELSRDTGFAVVLDESSLPVGSHSRRSCDGNCSMLGHSVQHRGRQRVLRNPELETGKTSSTRAVGLQTRKDFPASDATSTAPLR